MNNVHALHPCQLCDVRLAVPGSLACTMCDVEILGNVETKEVTRVG